MESISNDSTIMEVDIFEFQTESLEDLVNDTSDFNRSFETLNDLSDTMFIFRLFQNGLIFTSLVSGLISILHVTQCRKIICQNAALLLTLLVTGFCNMMVTVYMLQLSEQSSFIRISRGSTPYCSDYFLPATFSNTIVLSALTYCIIRNNIRPAMAACVVWTITFGCVLSGLVIVSHLSYYTTPNQVDGTFLTIGGTNDIHLDVFWSVCPTNVVEDSIRLLTEYGLIYLPITIAVIISWRMAGNETSDKSLRKLKIVPKDCCTDEGDVCLCSRFGAAYIAVLLYSTVVLFIARPLSFVYAHATGDQFRDILPSLLQTVLYCFICSEYLTRLFSTKYLHKRKLLRNEDNKVLYV